MVRRRVWVAEDFPRTTAREQQKIVESLGQKTFKKKGQTAPTSPHVVWEVSRKIILAHPKTNSSIFSYQTQLELQMGLASMIRCKKESFLAANTQDGFGEHGDKKYPMCTIKYTAVFCIVLI